MFNLADDVNIQYPNGGSNDGQGPRKKANSLNNT